MTRDASVRSGADFFEVRFESIGGLGAHVAGKIVASAAVLRMNMNGSHFSSYGSEKKGSVVRSFIRLAPAERVGGTLPTCPGLVPGASRLSLPMKLCFAVGLSWNTWALHTTAEFAEDSPLWLRIVLACKTHLWYQYLSATIVWWRMPLFTMNAWVKRRVQRV